MLPALPTSYGLGYPGKLETNNKNPSLGIFLCVWVHVCAGVHSCVNLYVRVEARGQPLVSPSVAANCVFETGSLIGTHNFARTTGQ